MIDETTSRLINHFKPEGATHYWIHLDSDAISNLHNRDKVIPFVLAYWKLMQNGEATVWDQKINDWCSHSRKAEEWFFEDAIPLN